MLRALIWEFYYTDRAADSDGSKTRKIFKYFIIHWSLFTDSVLRRAVADEHGGISRGKRSREVIGRNNEGARVRASLTARPWHPSDCIRPLRADYIISWKWKRAGIAARHGACTHLSPRCIPHTPRLATAVISCLIFACQRDSRGIARRELAREGLQIIDEDERSLFLCSRSYIIAIRLCIIFSFALVYLRTFRF